MATKVKRADIETHRRAWAQVGKLNGWLRKWKREQRAGCQFFVDMRTGRVRDSLARQSGVGDVFTNASGRKEIEVRVV